MKSDNTKELKYRLDTDTYEEIRYTIVPASDRWDSVADFTRFAIGNNIKDLTRSASGGRICNKLVRYLSDIRGIEEKEQSVSAKPKIENRILEKGLTANISVEQFGLLEQFSDEIKAKPATATGYCIFEQLSLIAVQTSNLDNPYERRVLQAHNRLTESLAGPKMNLHDVLSRRFRVSNRTEYFIQNDIGLFGEFATEYRDSFYCSDSYEYLEKIFGRRTFNDVENTIEEHTEISFKEQRDSSRNSSGMKIFSEESIWE